MTQRQFKKGDRVRLARCNPSPDGYVITRIGMTGQIVEEMYRIEDRSKIKVSWDQLEGRHLSVYAEHLEPLSKTLDTLTEGDVVVENDDTGKYRLTVLHVLKPGLYVTVDGNGITSVNSSAELEESDYSPLQATQDDTTCLTVGEVARKLGLDPDKLKIVAEKDGDD